MARVIFTAAVADIKGKLGGSVFQGSQYGAVLRRKVTPKNPQSSSQLTQRGNVKYLSNVWAGLTAEERQSWAESELPALRQSNNLPHKEISPLMAFIKTNSNLLSIGQQIKRIAPQEYNPKYYDTIFFTNINSMSSARLQLQNASNNSPQIVRIFMSRNLPYSVNSKSQLLKFFRNVPVTTNLSETLNIGTYTPLWGVYKFSGTYLVKIVVVDPATGLAAKPQYAKIIYP